MNIKDCLLELSNYYKLSIPKSISIEQYLDRYVDIIVGEIHKAGKKYDYDKLTNSVLAHYQYKTYPSPADIVKELPNAEIQPARKIIQHEGSVVRVYYQSGRYTDFVVTGFGLSLDQIKKTSAENVMKAELYPAGTLLMGDHIYPEGTQAKIVYISP